MGASMLDVDFYPSVVEAVTDVADVIIATGLISLIDDCIKSHFHPKTRHTHSVSVPLTPLKYEVEFVSPKAFFSRRNSGGSQKDREQRSSPLRHSNHVEAY